MLKKRVKGCYDRYPGAKEPWQDPAVWSFLEGVIAKICRLYGFEEVVTPQFEYTEVFTRSSGEASDIVSKEMYTFNDKKGRSLSLRPELTAPTIRAFLENGGMENLPAKLFYKGSCFRYDRAQKGRYRQFNQFGVEVIGPKDPITDIEVISMLIHLFKELGISKTTLLINSIGSIDCRKRYGEALVKFLEPHKANLSEDSQRRLETNPLRILDSKDPSDQKIIETAPNILDHISDEAKDHFEKVIQGLEKLGIDYKVDHKLVRGLDYYTDTVFELIRADDKGAQNSLGGGGVYAGLVKALGGKDIPGIGFALGMERTIQYLLDQQVKIPETNKLNFYFIGLDAVCRKHLIHPLDFARKEGLSSELSTSTSIKPALKKAAQKKAVYAIILGEEELTQGICKVKDLNSREESSIAVDELENWISAQKSANLALQP